MRAHARSGTVSKTNVRDPSKMSYCIGVREGEMESSRILFRVASKKVVYDVRSGECGASQTCMFHD